MSANLKFLKEIIKDNTPNNSVLKEVGALLKKINCSFQKNKIKAKAVSGGSVAKGTFIKGDYDVDIFAKFDYKYKEDDISNLLSKALKGFKAVKVHGSRDYFQITNKLTYEIIPVLDIKYPKKAANVTDMSPLHVAWVRKSSKFTDEIRLSKLFCKAQHCYGAESYIRGFSGHVLDILTIYHKGFLNLLKAAAKWKECEVVDFDNYYKGKALCRINQSKLSPLIVIDPIMPERNAAAALNYEKFEIFKMAAKSFLKKPSREFFVRKKLSLADIKAKAGSNRLIVLEIDPLQGKEDVIGTKILKVFEFLKKQIALNGFDVIDSNWEWNENAMLYFILDKKELSEFKEWKGPPLNIKERVKSFKDKHKNTYVKDNTIFAKVAREYRTPEQLLKSLIKDEYVRERVKSIKLY